MIKQDILFNRNIQIVFGVPGGEAFQYDGLRVSFRIEKNSFASPNKGKIDVYNLNAKSRGLAQAKNLVFILRAGYGVNETNPDQVPTNLPEIFKGDIYRVNSELKSPDICTSFEIGEGMTSFQQSRVDVSFSAGTAIKAAITQVAQSFGKAVGDLSSVGSGTFLSGVTLSGYSRDHMDYLADKAGLQWSIQNDAVQFTQKGKATGETAVLLTSSTGLLGIPKKKNVGIEFKAMMNPKLIPGRAVQLQSSSLNGNFRITRAILTGDNFGSDFNCDCEAMPI